MAWIGPGHAVELWNGDWQCAWPCGCTALLHVDETSYASACHICPPHAETWHDEARREAERAIAHAGQVLEREIARLTRERDDLLNR